MMSLFSWIGRAGARTPATSASMLAKATPSFKAVEIVPGENACCEAARALSGKRFLPADAPLFPVPDCDQPRCDCTYRRHTDRRATARRVSDLGIVVSGRLRPRQEERRRAVTRGRRTSDQSAGAM
jgi:hypothetical protein